MVKPCNGIHTALQGEGKTMAKVRFRLYEDRGVAVGVKPSEAAPEPEDRADTFWWDSAWELLHGLDVIELTEPPADYFAHLAARAARPR